MGAYQKDLRPKVPEALDRGVPRREAVGTFGVSPATLGRWLERRRERGPRAGALHGAQAACPRYPRGARL
jgi:hypothetical protein